MKTIILGPKTRSKIIKYRVRNYFPWRKDWVYNELSKKIGAR
jgi:hypothetical protein